jgi:thiamine-phosphate pyrophosphorylase
MRPDVEPDGEELRERLGRARLMLLLTPDLVPDGGAMTAVEAALPHLDVIQVRPKPLGPIGTSSAREAWDLCRAILDRIATLDDPPLVLVNDRVDVARALWSAGLAGVHLGQNDTPAAVARELLGPGPLIGLSTHDSTQVVLGSEEPVDYVGFGPVFATATKGYGKGLGAERAWVASEAFGGPLFAIGGIDTTNAETLAQVGRAAVGSAILCAADPGDAARRIAEQLVAEG